VRYYCCEDKRSSIYRSDDDGLHGEHYWGAGVWGAYPVMHRASIGELEEITEKEAKEGMKVWDEERPEWLKKNLPDSEFLKFYENYDPEKNKL